MIDAIKNQSYYLREQKVLHEPWFRCVRSLAPYYEEVSITPDMAQELLSSQRINFSKVSSLMDGWDIAISFFGKLLDGRDGLELVVSEGESRDFIVYFNVPEKFIFNGS